METTNVDACVRPETPPFAWRRWDDPTFPTRTRFVRAASIPGPAFAVVVPEFDPRDGGIWAIAGLSVPHGLDAGSRALFSATPRPPPALDHLDPVDSTVSPGTVD